MRTTRLFLLLPFAAATVALAADPWEIDPASFSTVLGGAVTTDTETVTIHIPAGAVVPEADIYLLADTTGSMGGPLTDVKVNAAYVAGALFDITDVDVHIGIGNYKDFPYDTYAFDHQLAPLGVEDEATVTTAIEAWTAYGGWDGSEAQLFALDRLANDADPLGGTIGWRDGAEKIIVWFGDWPGHDPICDIFTGLGYDITEVTVTADLVAEDMHVVAFSTTTGYGLDYDPDYSATDYSGIAYGCTPNGTPGQATRITDATGGMLLSGVGSTELADAIVDLVTEAVGTIDEVTLVESATLTGLVTDITDTTAGGCVGIHPTTDTDCTFDVDFASECVDGGETVAGTLDVMADGGWVVSQDVTIEIEDCCEAPVVETVDLEMWPPNHKYQWFDLSDCATVTTEDCDGSTMDVDAVGTITSVSSDEPEDLVGNGDGNTSNDMLITGPASFALRAERAGGRNGRVYTVEFEVTNQAGDVTESACTISVPHDDTKAAVNDGTAYTVTL